MSIPSENCTTLKANGLIVNKPALFDSTKPFVQDRKKHQPIPSTKTRPRTFLEYQPYIFGYSAAISVFSPAATAYQLCRLYKIHTPISKLARMSLVIFPHQTMLKAIQMNLSTPVKEYLNPWIAFGVVGILQGGVYGQCNVHFSNVLKLGKVASLTGIFRGSGFAGCRDMISQGVPFMCSSYVRTNVLDRCFPTKPDDTVGNFVKKWTSILSTSIFATYVSQGLHNFQITMQADQSLGYVSSVKQAFKQHGMMMFIRGAEARVGLLLIVNVLNELLLKPAWEPIPC